MKARLGYYRVDVTDFKPNDKRNIIPVQYEYPIFTGVFQAFNVNLESEKIPVADGEYDLVLCCEILEHMDVDPMFMLSEINRVLRVGGKILLTTPNVTSSRNVAKILDGYAPHFFMKYTHDRSPYRHNIEYAPDQVTALLHGAGFGIDCLWTADTFEQPALDAIDLLNDLGLPTSNRGDNILVIATKETNIRDRYPSVIYS
jgi:SAM-dependent methyltransferase